VQVVAFVQQLLSHGGYYDDQLEFIRIERIQVVATVVPGASAGRSQLSKRLVARLKVAVMGYPDLTQLEAIYARMLQQVSACTVTLPGRLLQQRFQQG
jgi:dynein heavy chain 2